MKLKSSLLVAALAATPCLLLAQSAPQETPAPAAASDAAPAAHPHTYRAHVLPPGAYQKLNLTADQQTQLKALEAQVQASLAKILTPAQLEQLNALKPPHHHGPAGGDGDRPPGGEGDGPPVPPVSR